MQLAEKQELVRLLNLYQADLLMDNDNNIREAAKHSGKKWEGTYSSIAEAAHDFWVKRKCGKDYRIVVLKSVEVKRVIDYYESKNFI